MKLEPVRGYKAAQYPTLDQYVAGKVRDRGAKALVVAVALAALSALMSGCSAVS